MNLQELLKQRATIKEEADTLRAQQGEGRLSTAQSVQLDSLNRQYGALTHEIEKRQPNNTLRGGSHLFGADQSNGERASTRLLQTPGHRPDAAYLDDFYAYLQSRGANVSARLLEGGDPYGGGGFQVPGVISKPSAASYEGGSTSGAPIVPVTIEQQIVPLAPPEMSVRKLAMVIPTAMDLKFPRKTAHGTAALKAESGASNNAFGGTDPSLEQFTLSAFMLGHIADASWELLQDVNVFQSFLTQDILLSLAILEDTKFVSGSGSGEPEGILGNIGAGVTGVAAGSDSYVSELLQATFDVMAALNAVYHPNASWLMARPTAVALRKAQSEANLFWPIFTRVGSQDYLHGYPIEYSTNMPAIAAGNTPVVFGDFKAGYIIGDRGGSGVNVKILDQTKAVYGLLEILGYRRTDGRVRRSEALQPITLHT